MKSFGPQSLWKPSALEKEIVYRQNATQTNLTSVEQDNTPGILPDLEVQVPSRHITGKIKPSMLLICVFHHSDTNISIDSKLETANRVVAAELSDPPTLQPSHIPTSTIPCSEQSCKKTFSTQDEQRYTTLHPLSWLYALT